MQHLQRLEAYRSDRIVYYVSLHYTIKSRIFNVANASVDIWGFFCIEQLEKLVVRSQLGNYILSAATSFVAVHSVSKMTCYKLY